MKILSKTLDGADAGEIELNDEIYALEVRSDILHTVINWQLAKRRGGNRRILTRAEVNRTGKKLYKQKGTGNARHGDKRAPIFVGGGVVFGPRPRDYSKHVTKSVRKLALRRVLGDLVRDGSIKTLPSFAVADGKTKSFVAAVTAEVEAKKVLIVAAGFDDSTYLAARNVQWVQLVTAESVNVEELLHAKSILLVEDAFETLAKRTA